MKVTTKLRHALSKGMVVAGSCHDAVSARLAEMAGFEAMQLGGTAYEISQLGCPDLGLITLTELADHTRRITAAMNVPLIVDVDTGFGGVLNVQRMVREMERAGAAGIHIEDQTFPKRCPLLDGRAVVGRQEAIDRVKAALDARTDPDFLIIARTDSDILSFDEMIERSNLFLEAGADMAMPITMKVDDQDYFKLPPAEQMSVIRRIVKAIKGPVLTFFPPPAHTSADLEKAGAAMTRFPLNQLGAAANAMFAIYREIRTKGTVEDYFAANPGPFTEPIDMMRAMRLDDFSEVERKFAPR